MRRFVCFAAAAMTLGVCPLALAGDGGTAVDAGSAVVSPVVVADPSVVPEEYARQVYNAVKSSNWKILAVLVLIGVVWILRKVGKSKFPWLGTDKGGVALVLATSVLGAMGNAMLAGAAFSLGTVLTGLEIGLAAGGGWSALRRLLGLSTDKEH